MKEESRTYSSLPEEIIPEELINFLSRNRITEETWQASNLNWDTLIQIAKDHESNLESLRDSAEVFARTIQRIPGVHSVRSRIKNTDHLLEKIVRKCAKGNEKYKGISQENYFTIVTDLVGVRALHLFKEDYLEIDKFIKSIWNTHEDPVAYIREGDPSALTEQFESTGLKVEKHPAGYRSIHYILSTQPAKRKTLAEIQVRTIFEEGWSEIDHRVRYPNFSDDPQVSYFLTIFNRLAGSADEMGTFVQGLTSAISSFQTQLEEEKAQKEQTLSSMAALVSELESMKLQDEEKKTKIYRLQSEISKMRNLTAFPDSLNRTLAERIKSINDLTSIVNAQNASPATFDAVRKLASQNALAAASAATASSVNPNTIATLQALANPVMSKSPKKK